MVLWLNWRCSNATNLKQEYVIRFSTFLIPKLYKLDKYKQLKFFDE
jgi:hypothetical protein